MPVSWYSRARATSHRFPGVYGYAAMAEPQVFPATLDYGAAERDIMAMWEQNDTYKVCVLAPVVEPT